MNNNSDRLQSETRKAGGGLLPVTHGGGVLSPASFLRTAKFPKRKI